MSKTNVASVTVYNDEKERELNTPFIVHAESLYVDRPVKTIDPKYSLLANLRNDLTWTDTFFDDEEDGIIAVFDFDYDAMESFYTSIGWATLASTILYTPLFVLSLCGLAPCFLRKNVRWAARSQHVAITHDGIRYVRDRRPCGWGLPCTDQGRSSKTVPFDMITDCDIVEPAGNSCICVPNVLSTVNVDTASSGTEGKKELKLAGLKDPHSFKKLVWAMKRAQKGASPITSTTIEGRSGSSEEDVASLLRDIRKELRINNELLLKVKEDEKPIAEANAVTVANQP